MMRKRKRERVTVRALTETFCVGPCFPHRIPRVPMLSVCPLCLQSPFRLSRPRSVYLTFSQSRRSFLCRNSVLRRKARKLSLVCQACRPCRACVLVFWFAPFEVVTIFFALPLPEGKKKEAGARARATGEVGGSRLKNIEGVTIKTAGRDARLDTGKEQGNILQWMAAPVDGRGEKAWHFWRPLLFSGDRLWGGHGRQHKTTTRQPKMHCGAIRDTDGKVRRECCRAFH